MMDDRDLDPQGAFGDDEPTEFGPVEGPLDCEGARARLPLFVGGDLDPDQQGAVGAHLEECVACRAAGDGAQRMRQVYFELASREPSVDLWSGVRAGLIRDGRISAGSRPAADPSSPGRTARTPGVRTDEAPGDRVTARARSASQGSLELATGSGSTWRVWAGGVGLAAAVLLVGGVWGLGGFGPGAPFSGGEPARTTGELAAQPTVLEDVTAGAAAASPAAGGLRTIDGSERLLNGAQPVILIPVRSGPIGGGLESLASETRYR